MKLAIVFGLCLAASVAIPAVAQEKASADAASHRHHVFHHRAASSAVIPSGATAQVPLPPVDVIAAPSFFPHIAPYANGQGDEDGLSRDVNDCNKGCVSEP